MKKILSIFLLLKYSFLLLSQNYDYDLVFQRLNFQVNPAVRFIKGHVDYYIKNADSVLSIDLSDSLIVDSILYHGAQADFVHDNNLITINLHTLPDKVDSVKIFYHGVPPETGMGSFTVGTHGGGVPVMWTLSEPYGARDWFPTKNNLGDKIDSLEVVISCCA
jgi:aminopeptidase N